MASLPKPIVKSVCESEYEMPLSEIDQSGVGRGNAPPASGAVNWLNVTAGALPLTTLKPSRVPKL